MYIIWKLFTNLNGKTIHFCCDYYKSDLVQTVSLDATKLLEMSQSMIFLVKKLISWQNYEKKCHKLNSQISYKYEEAMVKNKGKMLLHRKNTPYEQWLMM